MIEPALTPEEWKRIQGGEDEHGWPTLDPRATTVFDGEDWSPSLHALAARCLYNQPFGFTREDVRDELAEIVVLEDHRQWYEMGVLQFGADIKSKRIADLIERKRDRIARLQALLPPEDE